MHVHSKSGFSRAIYIAEGNNGKVSGEIWYIQFDTKDSEKIRQAAQVFLEGLIKEDHKRVREYTRGDYQGVPQVGFLYARRKGKLEQDMWDLLNRLEKKLPYHWELNR